MKILGSIVGILLQRNNTPTKLHYINLHRCETYENALYFRSYEHIFQGFSFLKSYNQYNWWIFKNFSGQWFVLYYVPLKLVQSLALKAEGQYFVTKSKMSLLFLFSCLSARDLFVNFISDSTVVCVTPCQQACFKICNVLLKDRF